MPGQGIYSISIALRKVFLNRELRIFIRRMKMQKKQFYHTIRAW